MQSSCGRGTVSKCAGSTDAANVVMVLFSCTKACLLPGSIILLQMSTRNKFYAGCINSTRKVSSQSGLFNHWSVSWAARLNCRLWESCHATGRQRWLENRLMAHLKGRTLLLKLGTSIMHWSNHHINNTPTLPQEVEEWCQLLVGVAHWHHMQARSQQEPNLVFIMWLER